MSSPVLFLTDLDHTLFQSHRSDASGTIPMTVDREGEAHGFARQDQKDLFEMMKKTGVIVPITARSHEQLERVTGWDTDQDYDLALTDLGATLLLRDNCGDGQWHAVELWHEKYAQIAASHVEVLGRDFQLLKEVFLPESEFADIVTVDLIGLGKLRVPFYITLSVAGDDAERNMALVLERFAVPFAKISKAMYTLHASNGVICLWPSYVTKGLAAQRFLELIREDVEDERLSRALAYLDLADRTVVTAGDALTDIDFMQHGHFSLTPKGSEIANTVAGIAQKAMYPNART